LFAQARAPRRSNTAPAAPPRLVLPASGVEFPPDRLQGISDLTNGFVESERDSYYGLLAHSRETRLAAQQRAARANLEAARAVFQADPKNRRKTHQLFYDLVTHPDAWRGQPVTLRGYIRDLTPMEAGENPEGLGSLYQAHLFTADSAQFPYVIVCSQIPDGLPLPTARRPTDYITVTGYFYKLWTYRAGTESGHWSAPLILAHRLEWTPPAPRPPISPAWWWLGAALLAAAWLGWRELQRRERAARRLLRELEGGGQAIQAEAQSRTLFRDLENR
ncbi:MAG: hypothetical protein ACKOGA_03985, partial [Planctomycetaceae bacterium]